MNYLYIISSKETRIQVDNRFVRTASISVSYSENIRLFKQHFKSIRCQFIYFYFMYMNNLSTYILVDHVGAWYPQMLKRTLDALGLEFEVVVSHHLGFGN